MFRNQYLRNRIIRMHKRLGKLRKTPIIMVWLITSHLFLKRKHFFNFKQTFEKNIKTSIKDYGIGVTLQGRRLGGQGWSDGQLPTLAVLGCLPGHPWLLAF